MFGNKERQRGSVTVFFALSLPVLLGVTAFAVDLGNGFYQKHRLQNIADSVALAGCRTLQSHSKVQLLSADTLEDDSKYNSALPLDKTDPDYIKAFTRSKAMLDSNNTGQDEDTKSKFNIEDDDVLVKVYTPGGDDPSKKTVKYYVVNLQGEVPTYFAGILGKDSFNISATSVAKIENQPPPVTEEEKEDVIQKVNANIHKTIPDYYSESIEYMKRKKDRFNPEYHLRALRRTEFTSAADYWSSDYYTKVGRRYLYNSSPDLEKQIAAYRDPNRATDPLEDKENNFAESFLEMNDNVLMFSRCTFNDVYEKTPIDYSNITGAFLDVPNMGSAKYRGLVFNIENNADQKLGNKEEPFYIRVESEPIRVLQGNRNRADDDKTNDGRTLVAPKIINVNESTRRPIVIAYDGPDQNRDQYDAPILEEYDPATGKTTKITTAITSTAPFLINLNKNFKGVLYAPRSHVHIYGTGKIDGLILARKITLHGNQSSTRKVTTTESTVDIPVWILDRETNADGSDKGYHDDNFLHNAVPNGNYRRETLTSEFAIAYDDFCNYTLEEVDEN